MKPYRGNYYLQIKVLLRKTTFLTSTFTTSLLTGIVMLIAIWAIIHPNSPDVTLVCVSHSANHPRHARILVVSRDGHMTASIKQFYCIGRRYYTYCVFHPIVRFPWTTPYIYFWMPWHLWWFFVAWCILLRLFYVVEVCLCGVFSLCSLTVDCSALSRGRTMSFPLPTLGKDGKTWYDFRGHPLAAWDRHDACRTCFLSHGLVCSPSSPCPVCRDWPDSLWVAVQKAETAAARKRAQRKSAQSRPPASVPPPVTSGSAFSVADTELLVSLRDTIAKLAPVFAKAGVPLVESGDTEVCAATPSRTTTATVSPAARGSTDRPCTAISAPTPALLSPLPEERRGAGRLPARAARPEADFLPFPDPPRPSRGSVWDR